MKKKQTLTTVLFYCTNETGCKLVLFFCQRFVVHDVVDEDLKNTYIEIMVMDKGRLRAAQPLGQVTTRIFD